MAHCNISLPDYGFIRPLDRRSQAETYTSMPATDTLAAPQAACRPAHSLAKPRVDFAVDLNVCRGAKDHRCRSVKW